jgi:hypothetical protein
MATARGRATSRPRPRTSATGSRDALARARRAHPSLSPPQVWPRAGCRRDRCADCLARSRRISSARADPRGPREPRHERRAARPPAVVRAFALRDGSLRRTAIIISNRPCFETWRRGRSKHRLRPFGGRPGAGAGAGPRAAPTFRPPRAGRPAAAGVAARCAKRGAGGWTREPPLGTMEPARVEGNRARVGRVYEGARRSLGRRRGRARARPPERGAAGCGSPSLPLRSPSGAGSSSARATRPRAPTARRRRRRAASRWSRRRRGRPTCRSTSPGSGR